MEKDTREELQRLEKELLEQDTQPEELTEEALLSDIQELLADTEEPVGEDPDVYSNYASDYDQQLQEFADNGGEEASETPGYSNKLTIGLLITAAALCLGIIGILIYWLKAFF